MSEALTSLAFLSSHRLTILFRDVVSLAASYLGQSSFAANQIAGEQLHFVRFRTTFRLTCCIVMISVTLFQLPYAMTIGAGIRMYVPLHVKPSTQPDAYILYIAAIFSVHSCLRKRELQAELYFSLVSSWASLTRALCLFLGTESASYLQKTWQSSRSLKR